MHLGILMPHCRPINQINIILIRDKFLQLTVQISGDLADPPIKFFLIQNLRGFLITDFTIDPISL
jgi:hypothetical protein